MRPARPALSLATLVSALVPALALAQGLHAPPRVDARRLTPGILSGNILVVRGTDTVRTGSWASEIALRKDTVIQTLGINDDVLGRVVDTVIDRSPDLQPIGYSHSGLSGPMAGTTRYAFDTARGSGSITSADGEVTRVDARRPRKAWHMASFSLVLASSDLREGATASMPMFEVGDTSAVFIDVTVAGSEMVQARACWKVVTDSLSQMAFWIDRDTRTIRRRTAAPLPGVLIIFEAAQAGATAAPDPH